MYKVEVNGEKLSFPTAREAYLVLSLAYLDGVRGTVTFLAHTTSPMPLCYAVVLFHMLHRITGGLS